MKPINQRQNPSSKSKSLAVVLFIAMSSHGAHAALTAWDAGPIVVGDKMYFYLSASSNLYNNASVEATEAGGIHSFNLTNLAGCVENDYLQYVIVITDLTNYFALNRTSQNDILGNITGSSTTTVYSNPFSTVLNTTPLLGKQTGLTYTTSGLQFLYVQTVITGVDGITNKIDRVTFDVTQTSSIPEVSSSFSLLGLISSGLLLRRRTKNLR